MNLNVRPLCSVKCVTVAGATLCSPPANKLRLAHKCINRDSYDDCNTDFLTHH